MVRKFEMKTSSSLEPEAVIGTTVYACTQCDYGGARDDTRAHGHQFVSVSLKPDGTYPFFTHPLRDLKEIKE
jgi:hypothetical protein